MLAGRGRSGGRSHGRRQGARHPRQAGRAWQRLRFWLYASGGAIVAFIAAVAAATTRSGQHVAATVMHFMLFYAGVFALIALTASVGVGLIATGRLVPELVQLDRQGYPVFLDTPVPFWLERNAQQAVAMCPALALRIEPGTALTAPAGAAIASPRTLVSGGGGVIQS